MDNSILQAFFDKSFENDINKRILEYDYKLDKSKVIDYLRKVIEIPIDDFIAYIDNSNSILTFGIDDIVQFSDINDGRKRVAELLIENGDKGFKHLEIGKMLQNDGKSRSDVAYTKYGENHAKFAKYFGYVFSLKYYYYASCIGYVCDDISDEENEKLFVRLFLRTNLFKTIYKLSKNGEINFRKLLDIISDKTYIRRTSSIRRVISTILQNNEYDFSCIFNLIKY